MYRKTHELKLIENKAMAYDTLLDTGEKKKQVMIRAKKGRK